MKTILTLFIALVFTGFASVNAQVDATAIVGKWKINTIHLNNKDIKQVMQDTMAKELAKLPEDQRAAAQGMAQGQVDAILKQMHEVTMNFQKDGNLTIHADNKEEKGTWKLSADKKQVIIREASKEKDESLDLLTATKAKLVLQKKEKTNEMIKITFLPAN